MTRPISIALLFVASLIGTASASNQVALRAAARLNKSPRLKAAATELLRQKGVGRTIWTKANPGYVQRRNGIGPSIDNVEVVGFEKGKITLRATVKLTDMFKRKGGLELGTPVTDDIEVSGDSLVELHKLLGEQPKADSPAASKPGKIELK